MQFSAPTMVIRLFVIAATVWLFFGLFEALTHEGSFEAAILMVATAIGGGAVIVFIGLMVRLAVEHFYSFR